MAGSPGRGASVPPYLRAAADLRRQILSGRPGPGERLPSVRALQQRYTIAGGTARRRCACCARRG
ncbi:GntR family transcriptional regulator [Streptomyces sp. NPDC057838]|uniref:GntR family transcriptional regulator n=1 Tax=unclassified Streptomyces TaxID=2593676 RepID=UPI0036B14FE6